MFPEENSDETPEGTVGKLAVCLSVCLFHIIYIFNILEFPFIDISLALKQNEVCTCTNIAMFMKVRKIFVIYKSNT